MEQRFLAVPDPLKLSVETRFPALTITLARIEVARRIHKRQVTPFASNVPCPTGTMGSGSASASSKNKI
jgi:hypothetical protein